MSNQTAKLVHRLALTAEAVCRRYLPNGDREGRYWLVGDARNTPGRSMYVRLTGPASGKRAAGKWTDAATGEYGDLLDIIGQNCGFDCFHDVADEARRFLSIPRPGPDRTPRLHSYHADPGSPDKARRLLSMSQPIGGTIVETYLRSRAITELSELNSLRFHPQCYYCRYPPQAWPAMIAAVTDLQGRITGAHRTWLDPSGLEKAPVMTPRRAMGLLLGHAMRIGRVQDVMAAGEGIETVLSLRYILPSMPMVAALSAAHLAAIVFPATLRRLYVARDNDPAGERASMTLVHRARDLGVQAIMLSPQLGDFNEDLRELGAAALRETLRIQVAPADGRFLERPA
jgi:Toprim domain